MKVSVAKNYFYNITYQILSMIIPLITTPYISRVLKSEGIGAFGYTNSITQYFVLFGCIGMNLYGQREVAYYQNSKEKLSYIFWELLVVRSAFVLFSMLIFWQTLCQNEIYGMLFRIQIIELFAALFDISWFFQGMEDFKKIVIRNIIVKLAGVVLIFGFVKESNDIYVYTTIYVVTQFLGNLSMWFYIPRLVQRVKMKNLRINRHLKPALVLFVPQLATNMYNLLDKSMIGYITKSDSEVAYYEQAQKIMKIALAIPTSLGTVMLPRIANLYSEKKYSQIEQYLYKSIEFVSMISIPLCFGVCAIARGFVPWFFGEGYGKVVYNLLIISPIIVIVGLSNVIGVQYLLPIGKQKEYTFSVVVGTIVNFLLNILFIPSLLSLGAAIASIIAELSVTCVQLYAVRKYFEINRILMCIKKYIFPSLIMAFFTICIGNILVEISIINTLLEILVGLFVYFVILIIQKNCFVFDLIDKIRKR